MAELIRFEGVSKIYGHGEARVDALIDASFEISEGEFVVILGPSGAGKSTLLNLMAGMDSASDGSMLVDGNDITRLSQRELADYRARSVGFVFQFYNLIGTLTALENVRVTRSINAGVLDAREALSMVGLEARLNQFPSELSGGEQQRVAIARAVAKNGKLLLCDEPTGALDSETGVAILQLLQDLCREQRKTVVIVTHNQALAQLADRVISMRSGRVTKVERNARPLPVSEVSW